MNTHTSATVLKLKRLLNFPDRVLSDVEKIVNDGHVAASNEVAPPAAPLTDAEISAVRQVVRKTVKSK